MHKEQQADGRCCHRNLEEDHASRCKKGSNTFIDSKVPKPRQKVVAHRAYGCSKINQTAKWSEAHSSLLLWAPIFAVSGFPHPQAEPGAPTRSRGSAACPSTKQEGLESKHLGREAYSTAGARSENKT